MSFSTSQQHVLRRNNRRYRLQDLGRFGINDTVASWASRVVANGGTYPSLETQLYLTEFWNGGVSDGWASKIYAMNCFVPDSFIAMTTPLIRGSTAFNDPWALSATGFAGSLSPAWGVNGWAGNGSSVYLNTGLKPTGPGATSATGYAWYVPIIGATHGLDLGYFDSTSVLHGAAHHIDNNTYGDNGNLSPVNAVSLASVGAGFFADNRTSSTDHRLYFANSSTGFAQIGSTDTVAKTQPFSSSAVMYVGCTSNNNTPQFFTSDTFSFVAWYSNMTAADCQNLFNRVQTLRRLRFAGGWV